MKIRELLEVIQRRTPARKFNPKTAPPSTAPIKTNPITVRSENMLDRMLTRYNYLVLLVTLGNVIAYPAKFIEETGQFIPTRTQIAKPRNAVMVGLIRDQSGTQIWQDAETYNRQVLYQNKIMGDFLLHTHAHRVNTTFD